MTRARIALLLTTLALVPREAHAGFGWLDWLDNLSGPGPSWGLGFGDRFC